MGLNRFDVVKQINLFSSENNQEALIKLLCEILDDEKFKIENIDLIYVIISIGELYGYYSYLNSESITFDTAEEIRRIMYRSYDNKIHYNSGQLSLLSEIKNENKLFISAPTTFGKTKLVLEYISQESKNISNILFLIPTNSLSEEIYIKLLKFNFENNLSFNVTTNPKMCDKNNILILTPEKYLLLLESKNPDFDLYVMDESYKIEEGNEKVNYDDPLNSRASKFRKIMEIIANKKGKTIFLSPFTYLTDDSMDRFFNKYNIKKVDRKDKYVNKNLIKVSESSDFKSIINSKVKGYLKSLSGVEKASYLIKELKNSTIVYVRFPKDALDFINKVNRSLDISYKSERFKKFINHLQNTYEFEGSKWYVLSGLKKGIGVYVSPMPRYIKREIVNLFNNNELDILVVTSAFAEGVNSTAKNIIITNDVVGSNIKMTPLDLLNLSGRAGRFGIHSQGNIYSVKEEIHNRLVDCIDSGVKISNLNYENGSISKDRTMYDIEIIDKTYLSSNELEIRNNMENLQKEFNLSDEDLNVALSISKGDKIKLYKYFTIIGNNENVESRIEMINNIMSDKRENVVSSMKYIFDELKNAGIEIYKDDGDIPAYSKEGKFLWGIFYGIHSSGNIKEILKKRKEYIIKEYEEYKSDIYNFNKPWINDFISNDTVDDFKLYNQAFRFISNIIEYRIPFYIGFYISIFKLFCQKNNKNVVDYDVIELSNILENKKIEEKFNELLEYGFSIDMIKKIQKGESLDEFEKIIFDEYKKIVS